MLTLLHPHPAALLKTQKTRTIIIADLHLGWEMALTQKGIHVPTQAPRLLKKLTDLIATYKPDQLLVLGDVKHTVATAEMGEWQDVPSFFGELKKQVKNTLVVRGNHDGNLEPLLPEDTRILPANGTIIGEVGFFHGHQWPSPTLLECRTIVMGHVHPVVALRDPAGFRITRQVWVKASCNPTELFRVLLQKQKTRMDKKSRDAQQKRDKMRLRTSQLLIMPSFNDFLGGRPLNEKKPWGDSDAGKIVGPVLRSEAVDTENAETYLLDGTYLGTLGQLRMLS